MRCQKRRNFGYIYLFFIYFSPTLYTPIPYSMTMTMIRQDKTIDEDKITENNKMIDNELMKMMGV